MTTAVIADTEAAVRTWARQDSTIRAVVADRVFFATPQPYDTHPADVWLTLFLVSETESPEEVGWQLALIQFDARGRTKALAAQAANAVQQAVRSLTFGPPFRTGQTTIAYADWQQRRFLPDQAADGSFNPRYSVDVIFHVYGTSS